MHKDIRKLRELTDNLPPLPVTHSDGRIDIEMNAGAGWAYGVLYQPSVAIAKGFFEHDSETPKHKHDEREWILVTKGILYVKIFDNIDGEHFTQESSEYKLCFGDYYFIPAGVCHTVRAEGPAEYIAITIPRSEVFPNVGRGTG